MFPPRCFAWLPPLLVQAKNSACRRCQCPLMQKMLHPGAGALHQLQVSSSTSRCSASPPLQRPCAALFCCSTACSALSRGFNGITEPYPPSTPPNSRSLALETHTWFLSNLHTHRQGLAWVGRQQLLQLPRKELGRFLLLFLLDPKCSQLSAGPQCCCCYQPRPFPAVVV